MLCHAARLTTMWRAKRPFVRNPRAQRKVFYDIKAGLLSGFFLPKRNRA